MNVLVVHSASLSDYPPVLSLCRDLLGLGHTITLLAKGDSGITPVLSDNPNFELVNLGARPVGPERALFDFQSDMKMERFCRQNADGYDVVWTTTNLAARACGKSLFGVKHVMQLMELAEYVPLFSRHDMPLHSHVVEELARRAFHVVVPEYNRAFIQQAWWHIPKTPVILPNKSVVLPNEKDLKQYPGIKNQFQNEKRKILLYQGAFGPDRDFSGCVDAMELLGDGYVLYLMGVQTDTLSMQPYLRKERRGVVLVPYVAAPDHLLFTRYGYIGLLSYQPSYDMYSPLNALYCAPNKIWEYARFGLPMIGSQMPALKTTFDSTGIGLTVDFRNSEAIAEAVRAIESDWNEMSIRSHSYFNSVDTAVIVDRILNDPSASL